MTSRFVKVKTQQKQSRPRSAISTRSIARSPRVKINIDENPPPKTSRLEKLNKALSLKEWRKTHFASTGDASKREVELLGEWLNSVLADNLEKTENPLDVVANAQHWYNVAYNELIRQVSVACVSRGRLFAIIWKRNHNIFSKIIELHRKERDYILSCHKERVKFLKTDLEFTSNRLKVIQDAYEEEYAKFKENEEKEKVKFQALEEKFDINVEEREKLNNEISELQKLLGINVQELEFNKDDRIPFVYSDVDLASGLKEIAVKLYNRVDKPTDKELLFHLDTASNYINYTKSKTLNNLREEFKYLYLSVDDSVKPTIHDKHWLHSIISFIYMDYCCALGKYGQKEMLKHDLPKFSLNSVISFIGTRDRAEKIMLDLVFTANSFGYEPQTRAHYFARFFGIKEKLSLHSFHFYLYILVAMQRQNKENILFSVTEQDGIMIPSVPCAICNNVTTSILEKLVEEKLLKFYLERADKLASSGSARFDGKALTELNLILEYMVTVYNEEFNRRFEMARDRWNSASLKEIRSYTGFRMAITIFNSSLTEIQVAELFKRYNLKMGFPLKISQIKEIVEVENLIIPFELKNEDFYTDIKVENLIPFIKILYDETEPVYNNIIDKLLDQKNEILAKQLRSSKAKFEQTVSGHSAVKTFHENIRDFFEKVELALMQV